MSSPRIVLASGSPYRRQQLHQLGLSFFHQAADVDETPLPDETADALAARLSRLKANAVSAQWPDSLVIGSDQTAALGDTLLGKPGSEARAREQLSMCSGRRVTFYTGLCLLNTGIQQREKQSLQEVVIPTTVTFGVLSEQQIHTYIEKEPPLDCAGSFKCEGLGIALFDSITSDDPSALIGLPLIALCRILRDNHCDPLTR